MRTLFFCNKSLTFVFRLIFFNGRKIMFAISEKFTNLFTLCSLIKCMELLFFAVYINSMQFVTERIANLKSSQIIQVNVGSIPILAFLLLKKWR